MKVRVPWLLAQKAFLKDLMASRSYLFAGLLGGVLCYFAFVNWRLHSADIGRIPVQLQSDRKNLSIAKLDGILAIVFSDPEASAFLRYKFQSTVSDEIFRSLLRAPYTSPYFLEESPPDSGNFTLRLRLNAGDDPTKAVEYLNTAIEMVKSKRDQEFKSTIRRIDLDLSQAQNDVFGVDEVRDGQNTVAWKDLITLSFSSKFQSAYQRYKELDFDQLRIIGDFQRFERSKENRYFGRSSFVLLLTCMTMGITAGLAAFYACVLSTRFLNQRGHFSLKKKRNRHG